MRIQTNVSLGVDGQIVPPPAVLELNDAQAQILVDRGFATETTEAVTWPEGSESVEGSAPATANLDEMTVAELKSFAQSIGIDITGLTTKAKLLEAISAKSSPSDPADLEGDSVPAGDDSASNEPAVNETGA